MFDRSLSWLASLHRPTETTAWLRKIAGRHVETIANLRAINFIE
jgi:hypothetical protein